MFEKAALANNWKNIRKIEIASGYLFGAAIYWYNDVKRISERVPEYVIKFKRLKKKMEPRDKLPDDYVVQLFLSGLRQEIAIYTAIKDPQTSKEAIEVAKQVGARKYYGKAAQPMGSNRTQDEHSAKRPLPNKAHEPKAPKTADATYVRKKVI
ncbi:25100_t:CDS:2, partial [Gigaspora rosea]